jgi:HEAT repeat protein
MVSILSAHRPHIAYLMQLESIDRSISMYQTHTKELGYHDFDLLHQMAQIILKKGMESDDFETQLLSLYGSSIAGQSLSLELLEKGIKSPKVEVQLAAVQFMGQLNDTHANELLIKAMGSESPMVRLEAGWHLATTKHPKATGLIEALMYKLPSEYWDYFPQFFALIGTKDAISLLKQLMENQNPRVRIESLVSAAQNRRDDLIPKIRSHATHSHAGEQEAAIAALGCLNDSYSVPFLHQLAKNSPSNVELACYYSLYTLGDLSAQEKIEKLALEGNLFAITQLGNMQGTNEILNQLLKNPNEQIRFNAALALLERRDPLCLGIIEEMVFRNIHDLGFSMVTTPGGSYHYWKTIYSLKQQQRKNLQDLYASSFYLREAIVRQSVELPEQSFLMLAKKIFTSGELEMVPILTALLANHNTLSSIELLKINAEKAGSPSIRAYCNLALFQVRESDIYYKRILDWIYQAKNTPMIQFKPMVSLDKRLANSSYELTPEESSQLLIDSCLTVARHNTPESIDLILSLLKEGHPKNRYVLAGILLQAIQ